MTDGGDATALLEIDALAVRRHREALLDDVSLRVRRGSIHVIVGPNGAGKSTLLAAILGQIPFDGRIAMNWTGAGTIGYVPQSFAVDPTLPVTVADFLALTRQRRPVCLGLTRAARIAIARLLDRVGLHGLERRPLAVLSGGELRRVLLAHALDPEPELLLLDEPTAGLDESAVQILDEILLASKRTGHTTVLMVSHDLEQVRRVADRVTVLDRRVVVEGSADVLATSGVRELLPAIGERRVARG
jgi:zinc transport system ATP-binding protein